MKIETEITPSEIFINGIRFVPAVEFKITYGNGIGNPIEEPKERYFKCLSGSFASCKLNKIYKGCTPFGLDMTVEGFSINSKAFIEETKEEYDKQELLEKIKPLFTFENHDYYEGDKAYWYDKSAYKVISEKILHNESINNYEENIECSKIYPTEPLCLQALHEWILGNHKVSESERQRLLDCYFKRNKADTDTIWSHFYCSQIIKQKQA